MTDPTLLSIFGVITTISLTLVGWILNNIRSSVKEQREAVPKMAEELKEYSVKAATVVQEEAKIHNVVLSSGLIEIRDSFQRAADRQDKLWDAHTSEHHTFRDIILGHEGRIASLEGSHNPKAPSRRRRSEES